jgi:uncharacterized protein
VANLFCIETDHATLQWSVAGPVVPLASGIEPPPGRLIVRPLRDGVVVRRPPPEHVRLFEQTSYLIHATAAGRRVRIESEDPDLLRTIVSIDDERTLHGTVNFGTSAGRSTFRLFVDDQPEIEFDVEVFPANVDNLVDLSDLIAETQDILSGLALEYLASTHGVALPRATSRSTHVEWLTILGSIIGQLELALRKIAKHPTRSLRREPAVVRLDRVRRLDAHARQALRRAPVPKFVETIASTPTLDTPEHRWLATRLVQIRSRLAAILAVETSRPETARQRLVIEQLHAFAQRIGHLQQLEPIRAASIHERTDGPSMQLKRGGGYREAYVTCTLLTKGLHIDDGAILASLKNLDVLYEYWCFLVVACRIAEATVSRKPLWDLVAIEETGLKLTVRQGHVQCLAFRLSDQRSVTVTYKPQHDMATGTMQPDVEIAIEEEARPAMIVALTANYHLPVEQQIPALHQYRDAVLMKSKTHQNDIGYKRMFVQGVSLYPYRERQAGEFEGSDSWSSLQQVGIGQLPLLPRGERYLDLWLESILREGGWNLAELTVPRTPAEAAFEWRRAESEATIIGLLRKGEEDRHLAWIRETRTYYTRATPQTKSRDAKWIAFYLPATSTGAIGAIRHWGEIESATEMPRSAIQTPWTPRHDPDEMQMIYRLKELKSGLNIQNARGERVSQNRWTTRLALLRARRLEHLAIETEPEWTLYEHLTAARNDVRIEPWCRPEVIDGMDRRGRATIIVGADRIRHRRGSRFDLTPGNGERREVVLYDLLRRY